MLTWIRAHVRDKTISHTVAERDESHGDEGGDGIADVSPVDRDNLADHQAANLAVHC